MYPTHGAQTYETVAVPYGVRGHPRELKTIQGFTHSSWVDVEELRRFTRTGTVVSISKGWYAVNPYRKPADWVRDERFWPFLNMWMRRQLGDGWCLDPASSLELKYSAVAPRHVRAISTVAERAFQLQISQRRVDVAAIKSSLDFVPQVNRGTSGTLAMPTERALAQLAPAWVAGHRSFVRDVLSRADAADLVVAINTAPPRFRETHEMLSALAPPPLSQQLAKDCGIEVGEVRPAGDMWDCVADVASQFVRDGDWCLGPTESLRLRAYGKQRPPESPCLVLTRERAGATPVAGVGIVSVRKGLTSTDKGFGLVEGLPVMSLEAAIAMAVPAQLLDPPDLVSRLQAAVSPRRLQEACESMGIRRRGDLANVLFRAGADDLAEAVADGADRVSPSLQ